MRYQAERLEWKSVPGEMLDVLVRLGQDSAWIESSVLYKMFMKRVFYQSEFLLIKHEKQR
jgi:hypothetical protein